MQVDSFSLAQHNQNSIFNQDFTLQFWTKIDEAPKYKFNLGFKLKDIMLVSFFNAYQNANSNIGIVNLKCEINNSEFSLNTSIEIDQTWYYIGCALKMSDRLLRLGDKIGNFPSSKRVNGILTLGQSLEFQFINLSEVITKVNSGSSTVVSTSSISPIKIRYFKLWNVYISELINNENM